MSGASGADILCQALRAEGVSVLFGHPGGSILPFYDAMYRDGRLRHVLTRHELGAAHAADGYARVTGQVGVCVATSGPGATNLVTGLATAMMDSVPMVAITGQVPLAAMGTEAFQEADILGVTAPVTKYGFLADTPDGIPDLVAEAFHLARSGRPGPVLIDVPKDVQMADVSEKVRREMACSPVRHVADPDEVGTLPCMDIERAAALLNHAERPVLMVGRGVVLAEAVEVVRRLAEWAELPVVTTLLGLDAFPARHPLALGLSGMHGTPRANHAIQEADLILGLGLRFDDRVIGRAKDFAPRARIVHFDIDSASIGRTVTPAVSVLGDLAKTLPLLAARIRPRTRPEWMGRVQGWDRDAEGVIPPSVEGAPSARFAVRLIAGQVSRSRSIVVTDVGQHQMWLAQELPDVEPRAHLTSGGLGTMGYALPAGIGAAVARPEREVWVVAGDGGFQMNVQELATAVQEKVRIRIAIVNNGFLGMVRQWQELFYGGRYAQSELSGPDFAALAGAYGIPSRTVVSDEAVGDAVEWASEVEGPVLLDLKVAREENVYPIVPAGAALHEFLSAPQVAAS
ncbi:MAG: biosynthetic-type acetolactate synthase large subunit [Longimicrobiales bacterium]|nr:biosynthetic-type acetolactate synthase large subunit [Longimicrobiales bacterium]